MSFYLFIGDSLGLPQLECKMQFEDTVASKLSQMGNLWLLCHTGATVTEFKHILSEFRKFLPDQFFDTVVIQLGLADCAPRPLANYWRDRLSKVKHSRLKKSIVKALHKYRPFIQKYIGYHQRTNYDTFRQDFKILAMMAMMMSNKVIVILMPPIPDSLEAHSPGLRKENKKYNNAMSEIAKQVGIAVIDDLIRLDAAICSTSDAHPNIVAQTILTKRLNEILGGVR